MRTSLDHQQLELLPSELTLRAEIGVEAYRLSSDKKSLIREVSLRNGETCSSFVKNPHLNNVENVTASDFDLAWLKSTAKPLHETTRGDVRLIDLFSGCGALSLGISEACRALKLGVEHAFAADINALALDVYARNFSGGRYSSSPLQTLVEPLGHGLSAGEKKLVKELGQVDILAGGPPCQGHSDLNNHTRRSDPKNALFETMIRFAQILQPKHVIIENVPGIRNDKRGVTKTGRKVLESMGYRVQEQVLVASDLGVAQRRRRYIMVATLESNFDFGNLRIVEAERTLRWACEDLLEGHREGILNSHASSSRENRRRIEYLFENDIFDLPDEMRPPCHRYKKHSYQAVYGRLRWDEPAPTITSGFNSPGQGRFVHPAVPRTLTPHEAARVQFLPDFFDWGSANREGLTQMVGNAVPPKLAYSVALELLR